MEIEIKIISIETIKPYSPTPKSLQRHNLSLLDQIAPPLFVPFVYFYASNRQFPRSEILKTLKCSLSKTLSIYYPLAGRLVGNLYVDCNDDGVSFFEAQANCDLSQVITTKNPNTTNRFLPYMVDMPHDFCMAAQVTYFRCGGVAIGILISHKIADGHSFFMFAKTWSATARGQSVPPPEFNGATYFPPLDISGTATGMDEQEVVTKIFTFSAAKIAAIRERYSARGRVPAPSRVEALSAFIWTQFMSAMGTVRSDPDKNTGILRFAVNLRSRADPPLSQYHFSNMLWPVVVTPAARDNGVDLVRKMKEGLKSLDGSSVTRLMKNGEEHLVEMTRSTQADLAEPVSFSISSICGFPMYEVDFGWGRPVWIGMGVFRIKNSSSFKDTKSEGGIEVLINLCKPDMEKFEAHLNLQMLNSNL